VPAAPLLRVRRRRSPPPASLNDCMIDRSDLSDLRKLYCFLLLFQISFLSGICVYVILDPERDCCMLIRYSLFDEHGDDLCRHETMNGSNEITCSRTCRRGGSTSTRRRANVRTTIGLVRTRGPKRSRVIKVETSHGAHTNKAAPEERSHGAHTNKATPEAK
jgi:hypothetical protein